MMLQKLCAPPDRGTGPSIRNVGQSSRRLLCIHSQATRTVAAYTASCKLLAPRGASCQLVTQTPSGTFLTLTPSGRALLNFSQPVAESIAHNLPPSPVLRPPREHGPSIIPCKPWAVHHGLSQTPACHARITPWHCIQCHACCCLRAKLKVGQ
jgi:hypothetical protein